MDRLWRRNQWLVLLAGAIIIGILLRAHALYRWDGVAMQHPDERFLVYTAYFLAVPSDFGAYLTACPKGDPDKTDTPEAKHFRSQPLPSLACNTLNPRNQDWSRVFVYGTLPTTVMRVVSSALYGQDAQPLQIRNVGRTLSLSADVLSILMLFFLARGVMNRPLAATVALLYALLPLPIQLSHFATVDAMAGPCIIGALALLVRWERLRWPGWIALAVCIGLASAIRSTNVSIWLLLPLVWLVRWQKPTWAQFSRVVGSGVLSIIVLWLADPTIWNGWWFDARWLHDVLLAGRLVNGMVDTPPTFQWSWQTPYIYPLSQMALWGMGLVVCSAGVAGWLLQCYRPRQRLWPVWLWVTAFVLWQGAVFGMTMRYYLPIYGAVCLLAVQVLPHLRRRWQRWLAATMVATTALLALGWSGLYATEHPRISASRWMYANIQYGSHIAVEVWDDVLPLTLSSTAKPNRYTTLPLDVFAPDRPHKYMTQPGEAPGLIEQLDRAEYVVLSSARGYGVLRHMPARFPIMQRYYAALFDGSLGFTLVHRAARWPHIGPWRWDTRGAEEALSVYDHPQVHIFAKTATYTHDRAVALLTEPAIWSSVAVVDTRTYRAWPHLGVVSSSDWHAWRAHQTTYAWTGDWAPLVMLLSAGILGSVVLGAVGWWRSRSRERWLRSVRALGVLLFQTGCVGLLVYGTEATSIVHQIGVSIRSGALQPLDPSLAGHLRGSTVPGWQFAVWLGQVVGADAAWSITATTALAISALTGVIGLVAPRWTVWPQRIGVIAVVLFIPALLTMAGLWHAGVLAWHAAAMLVGTIGAAVWWCRDALRTLMRQHWWGIIPLAVVTLAWVRLQDWQLPLQPTAQWLLVGWPVLVVAVRAARQAWQELSAHRVAVSTIGASMLSLCIGTLVLNLPVWVWLVPLIAASAWCVHLGMPRAWVVWPSLGLLWACAPLWLQVWLFPALVLAGISWAFVQLPAWRGWVPVLVGLAIVLQGWQLWHQQLPLVSASERTAVETLVNDRRGAVVLAGADGAATTRVASASGVLEYVGIESRWPILAPYDWATLRAARAGQIARIRSGALAPCMLAGLDYWLATDGTLTACPATRPLFTLPAPLVIPDNK